MRIPLVLFLSVSLTVVSGCGGSDELALPDGPKGKVKGKVTYKGKAVPSGSSINFQPIDATGAAAAAAVGEDGMYSLRSRNEPQVLAGKYKVAVSPPLEDTPTDEAQMQAMYEGKGTGSQPALPVKFADPNTSGLEFEVKEGEQTINIELKD